MRKAKSDPNPLPMSEEAERSILGAILLDNQCYFHAALTLRVDDFASDVHRQIYKAILELDANSKPFDYVTIAEVLRENGEESAIPEMIRLTDGMPQGSNIERHCEIISDYARRRRLVYAANAAHKRAIDLSEPIVDTIAAAQRDVLDIAASSHKVKAYKVNEYVADMFTELRRVAAQSRENMLGLTFGYEELDVATGGAMDGETIVIAGYSGDGKSILAGQMVYANLTKAVPSLIFTQEMTKEQYLRRMIPQATNGWLPGYHLRDLRGLSRELRAELDQAENRLADFPLWTVDASTVDISEVVAISRAMVRRQKIKLIVCDFIQLLTARGSQSDYDRVTRASGALRALAKDEGIVTVAVSQLTPAERGRKLPPNMFMLRSSGDIAQNAHMIVFIYRPENQKGYFSGKDQIRIGKMREGSGRQPFPVQLDRNTLTWVTRDLEKGKTVDDEIPLLDAKALASGS